MCVWSSLYESLLIFSVLPRVDWALWLRCLQGGGRRRGWEEKTLASSAKQTWGYRRARARWRGHRGARSHSHTCTIHAFVHPHAHRHIWRSGARTLSVSSWLLGTAAISCIYLCFSGRARLIYHVLSRDSVLMYRRKDSLWARTLNDILSRRDECDLHTQVEQIKRDRPGPWHFHPAGA